MARNWRRFEAWLFRAPGAVVGRLAAGGLTVLRYAYALTRDLVLGDLNLRAMSLVYTSLLSLVPLIAFSLSIMKGLGFQREFEPLLYEFFRPLGDRATELTQRVLGFVDHMQGRVLGSVGLVFLVWTVLSVIQKVEESFNYIWQVERARSFARRFGEYLGVLVVAPIVIITALGLVASLGSSSAVLWLAAREPFGTLLVMLGRLGPWLIVGAGFAFLYSFIPNAGVRTWVALVAGFTAGAAWVAASIFFTQLAGWSTRMMAVYASFAIVLLALMWFWLNWLVLLVGAQFAFYLQNPRYLRSGQHEVQPTARLREQLALGVMYLVGRSFETGEQGLGVGALAELLDVPSSALGPVVDALVSAGLLRTVEDETLLPGREPARIMLDAVLAAVRDGRIGRGARLAEARIPAPAERAGEQVDAAIRAELGRTSLRDFIARGGSS